MERKKLQGKRRTALSVVKRSNTKTKASSKTLKRKRSESNDNGSRKIRKQAAACSISQCKAPCLTDKFTTVETERFRFRNEEEAAIELTKVKKDDYFPNRRLTAFVFHDENGEPQPVEMVEEHTLYISGVILALEDTCDDEKETRIRCEGFGPIISWSLGGYDENSPIIWISTKAADYECMKPASIYQKHYNLFFQKACTCVEVYRRLSKSCGGNPNIGLNKLLKDVVNSMTERTNVPQGDSMEDLIISWGRFIFVQLLGLDETALKDDTIFRNLPVLLALRDASDEAPGLVSTRTKPKRRQHLVFSPTKFNNTTSEYDIEDDYPPPAYYQRGTNEIDEYDIFKGESDNTDKLPHYMLHNWCLYSCDGRFISLELLPMKSSASMGQKIFCSGVMTAGVGSRFYLGTDCNSLSSPRVLNTDRISVYLSTIKDWKIECILSTVSISIQTDIAWYRLGNPLVQYVPWYEPVLKTVTLAVSIVKLLKKQPRASRLSFPEVIKRVSGFSEDDPAYISSTSAVIESYVLVHGQTILKQFENDPDPSIRQCAFLRGLRDNLNELHRAKFVKKKIFPSKKEHVNRKGPVPRKTSKIKEMHATTTKLINRIWGQYCSKYVLEELGKNKSILNKNVKKFHPVPIWRKPNHARTEVRWDGEEVGKTSSGASLYKQAIVNGLVVSVGNSVQVETTDLEENPPFFLVEYMLEDSEARKLAHGRLMLRGYQTVLGCTTNERELFLTNHCLEFGLSNVIGLIPMKIQSVPWGYQHRKTNGNAYKTDRPRAKDMKSKGLQMEFFCRSLYCPERGAFLCLNSDSIGLGTGHCHSCKLKESRNISSFKLSRFSFTFMGTKYYIHDIVYLTPHHSISDETDKGSSKSSRSMVLKPFTICQFLGIDQHKPFKEADPESTILRLGRFFRPDDISADKAYHSDIREIYYSEQVIKAPVVAIKGKCEVREKEDLNTIPTTYVFQHIFFCELSYDPQTGALRKLPPQVKRSLSRRESVKIAVNKTRSKKCKKGKSEEYEDHNKVLATMDIYAGCGGLSSGFEQSGVSKTKWAIEYEKPAGEAFKLNHPDATIFLRNCNVILRAIMTACGDADDCISTPEAAYLAAKLKQKEIDCLPRPGDVDFIIGGPPCQGFSKMNRHSESHRSKLQCEMIPAFLSFTDYYRPKFFLLENVTNFISFNKGQIFSFTLTSLLEMGYQVRFGILEGGAYGVSQSRKRAFIWAASPEENLPEWPEPMYVFKGPELKVSLGGDIHYAAVGSTANGAPFRAITIRDTIGDLPPVKNGASKPTMKYKREPISWFQNQIRGDMQDLNDHISKDMDELNFLRCKEIPKRPGSDWRDLPNKQVKLSNGMMVDFVASWLPNNADKNNGWKGLCGRLDWAGIYPTCVTNPQPMGGVGRWFHPKQDRLLTVREYARAQGFPDNYQFAGNLRNKNRQVGNAVPPPLAFALGRKLKEAIEGNITLSRDL